MNESLTPRQIANRANAKKSTGPKSAEGKAKSSLNALKHGLRAEQLILPNEDPQVFQATVDDWIDALQPADAAESALVERAAMADWRLKRCVQAERARLAARVRHAATEHDLAQFQRAEELGLQLTYDPLNRCIVPPNDPDTLRRLAIWRQNNPAVIVRQLESFSEGVAWMINRWERLGGILAREGFWHYPEKYEAIRLLGLRPDDALNDEIVGKITLACRVLHPEPWDVTADIQQSALGCEGRPIYAVRAQWLETLAPKSAEIALNQLWDIIEKEVIRLRALKEPLAELAALDRRDAEDRAMFDDSKEAALAMRYESARDRELRRSLADLLKKRKEEEASAKRQERDVPDEPQPSMDQEVAKKTTTRRTAPPNEANERDDERSSKPSRSRKTSKTSPKRTT